MRKRPNLILEPMRPGSRKQLWRIMIRLCTGDLPRSYCHQGDRFRFTKLRLHRSVRFGACSFRLTAATGPDQPTESGYFKLDPDKSLHAKDLIKRPSPLSLARNRTNPRIVPDLWLKSARQRMLLYALGRKVCQWTLVAKSAANPQLRRFGR